MAYRETDKVRDRKALTEQRILYASHELVAEAGFAALQMNQVAQRAGIATGSLYRYFANKETLAAEVFRQATDVEVDHVRRCLRQADCCALSRLEHALQTFAERALKAPKLAWALIAEPVDPAVDQQRLHYRLQYANLFASAVQQAIDDQLIPEQDPMLSSTAMVGAIAEALIGPLAQQAEDPTHAITHTITQFCVRGLAPFRYSVTGPSL